MSERTIRARFNSRWRQVTILQCYAPTNEAMEKVKDDFYDQLQMVLEQVPCRDVKIVMGDMNAKVEMDNTGREEVMGKHEAKAEPVTYQRPRLKPLLRQFTFSQCF